TEAPPTGAVPSETPPAQAPTPETSPAQAPTPETSPAQAPTPETSRTQTPPPEGALTAPGTPAARQPVRWGPGRVLALVLGSLALLLSLGAIAVGGAGVVLDETQRDASGYLMTSANTYSTNTHALVSGSYRAGTANDWFVARDLLGDVRVRVESVRPVFIGIGPRDAVDAYLADVSHAQGSRFDTPSTEFRTLPGGAPASPPALQTFWSASASGAGQQTVTWTPQAGDWRVVLMNADGSAGVTGDVSVGARLPHLLTVAIAVLGGGIMLLMLGAGAIYLAVSRRR
ncbi:MAG TPA: hypothetical protein VE127_08505, partial [Solirubrobacteraceae bacterium]|nr:hypothetical protein [Solirubrobacteraceae bacterium]